MIKDFLQKQNINYEIILADKEVELTNKYDIKSVPTLVVEDNDVVEVYNNFSNIVKYIQTN